MDRELLATIAEQLSALVILTAKVYGGKNLPEPLSVPRPGQYDEDGHTSGRPGATTTASRQRSFVRRVRENAPNAGGVR